MKLKFYLSFFILILISVTSFAKDDIVIKAAPVIGYGFCWLDASGSGGNTEVDAEGLTYGIDLSAGRVFSDKLTIGADLTYQVMDDPDVTFEGENIDDFDIQLNTLKFGPFIRYFFTKNFYFNFSFGFSSFWSSGGDDMMDTTAYGTTFNLGAGYDYWFTKEFGICLFADAVAHYTWAEEDGVDFFIQSAYLPNIGIAGCYKF